eukprot:gene1542-927_t
MAHLSSSFESTSQGGAEGTDAGSSAPSTPVADSWWDAFEECVASDPFANGAIPLEIQERRSDNSISTSISTSSSSDGCEAQGSTRAFMQRTAERKKSQNEGLKDVDIHRRAVSSSAETAPGVAWAVGAERCVAFPTTALWGELLIKQWTTRRVPKECAETTAAENNNTQHHSTQKMERTAAYKYLHAPNSCESSSEFSSSGESAMLALLLLPPPLWGTRLFSSGAGELTEFFDWLNEASTYLPSPPRDGGNTASPPPHEALRPKQPDETDERLKYIRQPTNQQMKPISKQPIEGHSPIPFITNFLIKERRRGRRGKGVLSSIIYNNSAPHFKALFAQAKPNQPLPAPRSSTRNRSPQCAALRRLAETMDVSLLGIEYVLESFLKAEENKKQRTKNASSTAAPSSSSSDDDVCRDVAAADLLEVGRTVCDLLPNAASSGTELLRLLSVWKAETREYAPESQAPLSSPAPHSPLLLLARLVATFALLLQCAQEESLPTFHVERDGWIAAWLERQDDALQSATADIATTQDAMLYGLHDTRSALSRSFIHGMARLIAQDGPAAKQNFRMDGAAIDWSAEALGTLYYGGSSAGCRPSDCIHALADYCGGVPPVPQVRMHSAMAMELLAETAEVLTRDLPAPIPLLLPDSSTSSKGPQQNGAAKKGQTRSGGDGHPPRRGGRRSGVHDKKAAPQAERERAIAPHTAIIAARSPLAMKLMSGVLATLQQGVDAQREGGAQEAASDSLAGRRCKTRPLQEIMNICRRVLLPLLLAFASHDSHAPADTVGGTATTWSSLDGNALLPLLTAVAAGGQEEKLEEVVVLVAALFDFLFRVEKAGEEGEAAKLIDYRRTSFLWDTLHRSLQYAIRGTSGAQSTAHQVGEAAGDSNTLQMDAGRLVNMQLRVTYLLKRVIHWTILTHPAAGEQAPLTRFHDLFPWDPRRSPEAWSDFFLVMDTANEFNLHIILPVLKRLDTLVEANLMKTESTPACLPPAWLELLLLKLLRHPNTAVRKVVLRRLWLEWPLHPAPGPSYANALSPSFLFHDLFGACADPRLCSDIDRLPVSTTFLEMKAFEWEELPESPASAPIAASVEHLYRYLFVHRLRSGEARAEALELLLRAVRGQQSRFAISIFTRVFTAIAVALHADGTGSGAHRESAQWSVHMLLHPSNLSLFTALIRECIQDNVSFWLEVRLSAIVFAGLLRLSLLDPVACRQNPEWWRLLCHCGPLAVAGGRVTSQAEGCGHVVHPASGAGLDTCFMDQFLCDLSARCPPGRGSLPQLKEDFAAPATLLHALLGLDDLYTRTEALLHVRPESAVHNALGLSGTSASSSTCPSLSSFSVVVKEHFFLVGALARHAACSPPAPDEMAQPQEEAMLGKKSATEDQAEKTQELRRIAQLISQELQSCFHRPYCSPYALLAGLMAFVEFSYATAGSVETATPPTSCPTDAVGAAVELFSRETLTALLAAMEREAFLVLEEAQALLGAWRQQQQQQELRLATGMNGEGRRGAAADWWEVLMAAIATARGLLARQTACDPSARRTLHGLCEEQQHWLENVLPNIFQILEQQIEKMPSSSPTLHATASPASRPIAQTQVLLLHHTTKWLQSEVAGVLMGQREDCSAETITTAADEVAALQRSGGSSSRCAPQLPCSVETTPMEALWWDGCAAYLRAADPYRLERYTRCLITCLTLTGQQCQHLGRGCGGEPSLREQEAASEASTWLEEAVTGGPAQACPLARVLLTVVPTATMWTDVLTGMDRAVYNTLYTFAPYYPLLLPDGSAAAGAAALVRDLEAFALDQLERCWTINLPCVFDLLVWLCGLPVPSTDPEEEEDEEKEEGGQRGEVLCVHRQEILRGLLLHQNDAGAKQQTRLVSLVYAALRCSLPYEPEVVLHHLRDMAAVSTTSIKNGGKSGKAAAAAADSNKHQSQREVYLSAATVSLAVLEHLHTIDATTPEPWWIEGLLSLLQHWAIFYSPPRDAENESTQAVTEAPLATHWPEALRRRYPAGVNMALLGRALCVSTLLSYAARKAANEDGGAVPMVMALLELNTTHPTLTSEPCMPNSETHRTRLRVWQLLNALQPLLPRSTEALQPVLEKVAATCIPLNNLSSVRRFMEVFCIALLHTQPGLFRTLDPFLGTYSLRPQVMGTFVLIAGHALLSGEEQRLAAAAQCGGVGKEDIASAAATTTEGSDVSEAEAVREAAFRTLFPRLLQQSTSHQHLLRIISHIAIYRICKARLAAQRELLSPPPRVDLSLPPGVQEMYDYICVAEEHVKFREKHEHMLFYDTTKMCSPRSIFSLQRRESNMVLCDAIPAAMFERMMCLETELASLIGARFAFERLRLRRLFGGPQTTRLLRDCFAQFPYIPHTTQQTNLCPDYTTEAIEALWSDPLGEKMKEMDGGAAEDNVQRKTVSWWTSEVHNELHPRSQCEGDGAASHRHSVVVVATLLENPVNIAGLCRCADIFAIEELVVPDTAVFEHPHFVAVARSAERWVPWRAVAVPGLATYLASMRAQGYTLVGIEQTTQSVSIERFDFPERSVLVLGSEGQGIPAPLIPLLDVCVEIPQYGLVRSLNVHVTGAVAMYEYTLQHIMGNEEGGDAAAEVFDLYTPIYIYFRLITGRTHSINNYTTTTTKKSVAHHCSGGIYGSYHLENGSYRAVIHFSLVASPSFRSDIVRGLFSYPPPHTLKCEDVYLDIPFLASLISPYIFLHASPVCQSVAPRSPWRRGAERRRRLQQHRR